MQNSFCLKLLLFDLLLDVCFDLFPVLDILLEHFELVFQVVDFILLAIYLLLLLSDLPLLPEVLLLVNQELKLSRLFDGYRGLLKPHLISDVISVELISSCDHLGFDMFFIRNLHPGINQFDDDLLIKLAQLLILLIQCLLLEILLYLIFVLLLVLNDLILLFQISLKKIDCAHCARSWLILRNMVEEFFQPFQGFDEFFA